MPRHPSRSLLPARLLVTGALLLALVCGAAAPGASAVPPDQEDSGATTLPQQPPTPAEATAIFDEAVAELTAPVDGEPSKSATMALLDIARTRPFLSPADRRAAARLLARPTDRTTSEPLSLPAQHQTDCTTSARFCLHYVTAGRNATTAAQAAKTAAVLDEVYQRLVGRLGYRAPLSDLRTADPLDPGNPDGRFDVFLGDLGSKGLYGYCAPTSAQRASAAYCALDNDFAEFSGRPDDSLRVTAAHEFFHAIQFAYDTFEDRWFMEGSAVWAEEQLYDGVNDYRQYLAVSAIRHPTVPIDMDSTFGTDSLRVYASGLFFFHLTETLGVGAMRRVWERAAGNRFSLQAVRDVVSATTTSWPAFMARFGVWNTRPPGMGYSERGLFPAATFTASATLGWRGTRAIRPVVRRIDHLASVPVRLAPATHKSSARQRLRVVINGPQPSRGATATVQRRLPDGRTAVSRVTLNRYGDATVVVPFTPRRVRSVVVTMTNASTAMRGCGTYNSVSYSCGGWGAQRDSWRLDARVLR